MTYFVCKIAVLENRQLSHRYKYRKSPKCLKNVKIQNKINKINTFLNWHVGV
jgi:hypothetical protein